MSRRCSTLLAGLFAALCSLSGRAAEAPDDTHSPKPLVVWTRAVFNSREGRAITAAVERFNRRQQTLRVELSSSNYPDYGRWVREIALTGALPCVVEVDAPFVAEFAWSGFLQPLDHFMPPALRQDLLPSMLQAGQFDGRLYSVGQFESGLGLWAHRRRLSAAGVRVPTVAQPWRLDEFEQALQRLARLPGIDYPLSLALYTGTSEFLIFAYLPWLVSMGGDVIERKHFSRASGVFDGPASVAAFTRLQRWLSEGWTRAVYDRSDDFERDRVALLWTGHWKYHALREALGDDLVLLPLPDFGHGLRTGMGSWSWAISSTCATPRLAWQFIEHLMSPDEVRQMAEAAGAIPARRSVLSRSTLYGPGGPLSVYTAQLVAGAGVARPSTPAYPAVTEAFGSATRRIVDGAPVLPTLRQAAETIDRALTDHGVATP